MTEVLLVLVPIGLAAIALFATAKGPTKLAILSLFSVLRLPVLQLSLVPSALALLWAPDLLRKQFRQLQRDRLVLIVLGLALIQLVSVAWSEEKLRALRDAATTVVLAIS